MTLAEIYPAIKKSIVAFVPKYLPSMEKENGYRFPPILGTGFAIREDGLVATNHHVVDSFADAWRPPGLDPDEWGIDAMLLYPAEKGIIDIRIPVIGVINIGSHVRSYGPKAPDLSFVRVLANDLTPIKISETRRITEGLDIGTAGYPLGRRALDGPWGLHQVTPTLQKGIISAVLPYPSEKPYSFSVNIMSNSGGSGSPVFFEDSGELAGILFSVLNDVGYTKKNDEYLIPTTISYAVPFHYILSALSRVGNIKYPEGKEIRSITKIVCESSPGSVYREGVCYHDYSDK
ncbi:S1 family peptidase [Desulforegula conservatrix]|uniref:S1 family peptidase n=1 Tax=Desulforegula conservatrix TaxID=153026 RepID=UPI000422EFFE|nr:serine protease [Desulforegula conservatrix]